MSAHRASGRPGFCDETKSGPDTYCGPEAVTDAPGWAALGISAAALQGVVLAFLRASDPPPPSLLSDSSRHAPDFVAERAFHLLLTQSPKALGDPDALTWAALLLRPWVSFPDTRLPEFALTRARERSFELLRGHLTAPGEATLRWQGVATGLVANWSPEVEALLFDVLEVDATPAEVRTDVLLDLLRPGAPEAGLDIEAWLWANIRRPGVAEAAWKGPVDPGRRVAFMREHPTLARASFSWHVEAGALGPIEVRATVDGVIGLARLFSPVADADAVRDAHAPGMRSATPQDEALQHIQRYIAGWVDAGRVEWLEGVFVALGRPNPALLEAARRRRATLDTWKLSLEEVLALESPYESPTPIEAGRNRSAVRQCPRRGAPRTPGDSKATARCAPPQRRRAVRRIGTVPRTADMAGFPHTTRGRDR